jgi:hypothetical protein
MAFLDDGRLELDTNPVENAIRPICLTRKNALFAGHEIGAEHWALLASIVATCVDKGYRGHNYPNRFKVWTSGQVRRVTKTIRREMKRRAAVEPVIGHLGRAPHGTQPPQGAPRRPQQRRARRRRLQLRLLLRWFERLLRALWQILCQNIGSTQYF